MSQFHSISLTGSHSVTAYWYDWSSVAYRPPFKANKSRTKSATTSIGNEQTDALTPSSHPLFLPSTRRNVAYTARLLSPTITYVVT